MIEEISDETEYSDDCESEDEADAGNNKKQHSSTFDHDSFLAQQQAHFDIHHGVGGTKPRPGAKPCLGA